MHLFKNLLKPITLIAFSLLFILLCIRVFDPFWVQTVRLASFDYYQVTKPREYSKQPIVIVDIDEESLRQYGQWPWPRTLVADLITGIPDNEERMAEVMRQHPVILGQAGVRNFSDIAAKQKEIRSIGFAQVGLGIFNIKADIDNVVRRVPLVVLVRDKLRLALSLEVLRVATGGESFTIKTNQAGLEGIAVAGSLINTDGQGNIWPYFSPPNAARYISASAILNGSVDANLMTGNMVLIGTSATGLEDYRAFLIEIIIAMLAGFLVIALVSRLGGIKSSLGVLILIASLLAYSWWNFSNSQFLIDATYPIIVTSQSL